MTAAEKAAAWIEQAAADETHGYDQERRWGPDYDCSSLVISAYQAAGVPLTCSYTGNMRADMLAHGFAEVTGAVDTRSGAGLRRGDVLLHERSHAAMFVGGGQLIHARGNEHGSVTGGQTGDQTGTEICRQGYFDYPWEVVLRYEGEEGGPSGRDALSECAGGAFVAKAGSDLQSRPGSPAPTGPNEGKAEREPGEARPETYTVRKGDMLGRIAERFGCGVAELARLNNIQNVNLIYPGQVLLLPGGADTVTLTLSLPRAVFARYGSAERIAEALCL